jgi:UDP-N-acetylglucosamine--N-acetylmuramyl-(pentapeptide) pyrophosphoryl-undecaprenol N-acetylglucosamine transferase
MKKTICFVAGHSGGHILPSLTHAKNLVDTGEVTDIIFFSTNAALDKKIISRNSLVAKLVSLSVSGIPYGRKILLPLFFAQCLLSFFQSLYHLILYRPQAIISMGGLISVPVCCAGWLLRIPIELYELNVEPGKAITFLAYLAQKIYILHPETASYLPAEKCAITEYPLRFSEEARSASRHDALNNLELSPAKKTIFVLGGSQGSLFLNKLIKQWVYAQKDSSYFQIIHQTGEHDTTDWKKFYAERSIHAIVFSYHENLAIFYQAADLVISRAGAGTLAELDFFKKKSLIIPLETARTNHQIYNARAYVTKNPDLFCVIEQKGDYASTTKKIDELIALN